MKITHSQFKIIEHLLPIQRGNVKIPNIQVINAILYVAEHGCNGVGCQSILASGIASICALIAGPKAEFWTTFSIYCKKPMLLISK